MQKETSGIIDAHLNLEKLGVAFTTKPLIFGGLAMEYHGLRKRGSDIDMIVSFEDYEVLEQRYPACRKDSWGDLGIAVHGCEMFRTVWKLDYEFLSAGSHEYRQYRVISIERLLLMKVLAMNADEKHRADVDLITRHILDRNQRMDTVDYMNAHIQSYLASADGFVYNGEY